MGFNFIAELGAFFDLPRREPSFAARASLILLQAFLWSFCGRLTQSKVTLPSSSDTVRVADAAFDCANAAAPSWRYATSEINPRRTVSGRVVGQD